MEATQRPKLTANPTNPQPSSKVILKQFLLYFLKVKALTLLSFCAARSQVGLGVRKIRLRVSGKSEGNERWNVACGTLCHPLGLYWTELFGCINKTVCKQWLLVGWSVCPCWDIWVGGRKYFCGILWLLTGISYVFPIALHVTVYLLRYLLSSKNFCLVELNMDGRRCHSNVGYQCGLKEQIWCSDKAM